MRNETLEKLINEAHTQHDVSDKSYWMMAKEQMKEADVATATCALLSVLAGAVAAWLGVSLAVSIITALATVVGWVGAILLAGGLVVTAIAAALAIGGATFAGLIAAKNALGRDDPITIEMEEVVADAVAA